MNPTSFRDQFSLDYIAPSSTPTATLEQQRPPQSTEAPLPPGLEAVLQSYSGILLRIMKSAPEQTIQLLDLAQQSSTRFEALLPMMHYLVSKGLVERVVEDPSGNDTYRAAEVTQTL